MSARACFAFSLAVLLSITACAKTQVSDREPMVEGKIARPAHIWVYDFTTQAADVPSDSSLAQAASASTTPQSADEIAQGDKVGPELAKALVAEIIAMGMPAKHASSATTIAIDDLVIRGYLLSVEAGSATERVAIGMGKGAAELKVAVEGFQMTATGLRKLGGGKVDTQASKAPGAVVPLAVTLATHNPLGLIVNTGVKLHDEADGKSTLKGKVEQVAKEIAGALKPRFQQQGWI